MVQCAEVVLGFNLCVCASLGGAKALTRII